MLAPTMPFGKHAGRPLTEIPDGYLHWLLTIKLGSGLRLAVADELRTRGQHVPEQPPPRPPRCPTCRSASEPRYCWQEDSTGRRRIRAECAACQRWLGFAPEVEPYTRMANSAVSQTAALDVLCTCAELGIDLRSDGQVADFATHDDYRRAPERLRELLMQCRYRLGHLMGRREP
jgi:hypothetical protein